MRSKVWTPEVEARRVAKRRRRSARRAMAKLLSRLAIPGQPGAPGYVVICFVPDPPLDRAGVRHTLPGWWAYVTENREAKEEKEEDVLPKGRA